MRTIRTAIATAAFILAPIVAHAAAPASRPEPMCKKTTTFETDAAGRTVIRTKTTCTIEGSK